MTKKLFLLSSLFCLAQASQSWTDTAISWTKGAAAAFVAGCSAQEGLNCFDQAWKQSDWRFVNSMRSIGYAYAVSKIAPFSRDCFNLKESKLLESTHPIAKDRKKAFIEAVTRGCVAVPCVTEIYRLLTKEFQFAVYPELKLSIPTFGKICGMGYTLYHALPYVYKNSRVALAI